MQSTNGDTPVQPTRLLHTMLRISDLDLSLKFYCDGLGMRELRREVYPDGKFTLAYVGYDDEASSSVVVLTHNADDVVYSHGTGFGHIALAVSDLVATCGRLEANGATILRQPGPMIYASENGERDIIAFVADPDGYRVELIEMDELSDEK